MQSPEKEDNMEDKNQKEENICDGLAQPAAPLEDQEYYSKTDDANVSQQHTEGAVVAKNSRSEDMPRQMTKKDERIDSRSGQKKQKK